MTTERKLEIHYAEDRIRAEVAEEIAAHFGRLARVTMSPAAREAWRSAAAVAREHAAKGFPSSVGASVVSAEGSGQRCPSRESGGRHGCDLPAGHDGMHEVRVTRFFANDPAPGPWTGPRPTLSPPDTEGEPNA